MDIKLTYKIVRSCMQTRYKMYVCAKGTFTGMQLLIQNCYIQYKMTQFCMSLVHVLGIHFGYSLYLFLHKKSGVLTTLASDCWGQVVVLFLRAQLIVHEYKRPLANFIIITILTSRRLS